MARLTVCTLTGVVVLTGLGGPNYRAEDPPFAPPPAQKQQPDATVRSIPTAESIKAEKAARDAEAAILRALQAKVTLEFQEVALADALSMLADEGHVSIWLDVEALKEEGIGWDAPVTVNLKAISIEQALNRILSPLRLTWLVADEVVKVTTPEKAGGFFQTRVYDVRALQRLSAQLLPDCPERESLSWLLDVVRDHMGGDWQGLEGRGGTVALLGDLLIVWQTWHVQREVAGLVGSLTTFADSKSAGDAVILPSSRSPVVADRAVREALQRKVTLEYIEKPFAEVAADLQKLSGTPILIDERELSEEGIATDTPVTLEIADVSLHSVLKLLVQPLALSAYFADGAFHITTNERARHMQFAVVYDARNLVKSGFVGGGLAKVIQTETTGPWQTVDGTGGIASEPLPGLLIVSQNPMAHAEVALLLDDLRKRLAEAEKPAADEPSGEKGAPEQLVTRMYSVLNNERASALEKVVPVFVAPGTWDASDGPGVIRRVETTLVIRQTPKGHAEIAKFLKEIFAAETGPAASSPIPDGPRSGGSFF
jgi:hypothetical protein